MWRRSDCRGRGLSIQDLCPGQQPQGQGVGSAGQTLDARRLATSRQRVTAPHFGRQVREPPKPYLRARRSGQRYFASTFAYFAILGRNRLPV